MKSDYLKAAEGAIEATREVLADTIREAAEKLPYHKNSQEVLDVHNAESLECQSDKECEAIAGGLNAAYRRGLLDAAKICEGPFGGTDAQ